MRGHRVAAAAAAVLALALAACSGGDDAADTTVAAAPTVSVDTSPTASSAPSPTAAPTSTTTTTTITATTTIPPDPEQAVADAVVRSYEEYVACFRAPSACDPSSYLADPSEALDNMRRTIAEIVEGGSYAGPEETGVPVVESIELADDGMSAQVRYCLFDTGVLYGPAGPNGEPVPIANTPTSFVFEATFVLLDVWRLSSESVVEREPEVNLCV
jgi:hypothetical protein